MWCIKTFLYMQSLREFTSSTFFLRMCGGCVLPKQGIEPITRKTGDPKKTNRDKEEQQCVHDLERAVSLR